MFAAKGRPADHPVIVHLADTALLPQFASEVSADAWKLADAFWPGPMTLVLRRSTRVNNLVTGGLETVGLRVPAHPVAQALLRAFGGPIAAPSANRFGRVSATRAEHVAEELTGYVEMILDGGECDVGVESTIIDLTSDTAAILRPGGVTAEQVASALGRQVGGLSPQAPRVSGSLPSHYAPRAKVEIVSRGELATRAEQLAHDGKRVAVLSSEPIATARDSIVSVPLPADAGAQAHSLYDLLRRVDALGCDVALISLPDEQGIGVAIADRLRRAAGPR
jgi:L-threonylcarbamoyladenylate synthase